MKVIRDKKKLIVLITVIVLAILICVGVAVNATGSNGVAKSVTFSEDMDGAYVYFRAVDAAGNVGEWSEPQRLFIDTTSPSVTAKQSSVTITEGEIYSLVEYFTVEANGGNDDINVVCKINGIEYEDTENLTADGSPYTVICTATKNGGKSGSAQMELVVESAGGFARGSGSSSDPYIIETANQLKWLATTVNAGENYYSTYIKLGANIDLGGIQAADGTWSGKNWTPIGVSGNVDKSFCGNFDGGGFSISNLYVSKESRWSWSIWICNWSKYY